MSEDVYILFRMGYKISHFDRPIIIKHYKSILLTGSLLMFELQRAISVSSHFKLNKSIGPHITHSCLLPTAYCDTNS
jgi:hypothetical protein